MHSRCSPLAPAPGCRDACQSPMARVEAEKNGTHQRSGKVAFAARLLDVDTDSDDLVVHYSAGRSAFPGTKFAGIASD